MRALPILLASSLVLLPASPAAVAYHLGGKCVSIIEGGDVAYRVCVNPRNPDCLAYVERETFLGTEAYCVVPPGLP